MEHKVVKKTEVKVEEAKSKKDRELQEAKMSSEAELRNIVKPLVNWYRENKRDLPWRHNPDAYRVWVSEIMLQQTRVEAVKGYYDRFLKALPTVKDLAEAEEDKLLKLWEGLGYYNRVRNMQKAAQQIMVDHAGRFIAIEGNWQLHGGGDQCICLWNPETGSGWQCAQGDFQNYG